MNLSPGNKPMRSPSPRHRVLIASVVAMLAMGCFFAGQYASRYAHASRAQVALPQPPFALPAGHRAFTLPPEWIDGTARERERIDLITLDPQTQAPVPLILDALVLHTHPSLTLLVSPRNHHILTLWSSQPDRAKLRPRPTVAVTASESVAAPGSRSTVN